MASEPQNLSNHARYVPGYHFVLAAILLLILGWQIVVFTRIPGFPAFVGVMLAVALILQFWYMRVFAVTVQDRVIRLEERMRMERLLAPELKGRIGEFTPRQLVALRFASDAELPALARRVLEEQITSDKAIKAMVKEWRADYLRA